MNRRLVMLPGLLAGVLFCHSALAVPNNYILQYVDDFDGSATQPKPGGAGLGPYWGDFGGQYIDGSGNAYFPQGAGEIVPYLFTGTNPLGAWAEASFNFYTPVQCDVDPQHNAEVIVRGSYGGKYLNDCINKHKPTIQFRRGGTVLDCDSTLGSVPGANDTFWIRLEALDGDSSATVILTTTVAWSGAGCPTDFEQCEHKETRTCLDPNSPLYRTTGQYGAGVHHANFLAHRMNAGSLKGSGGGPGGGPCSVGYESDKSLCGFNTPCHQSSVLSYSQCVLPGNVISLGVAQIFGRPQDGYPLGYTFQAPNNASQPVIRYVTVLNGANGQNRVSGARIRLNGIPILDGIGSATGWSSTAIELPPGMNQLAIDNQTTTLGVLSLFLSEQPLQP